MLSKLQQVVTYAIGDVRALVPARKAVWPLPGEPKASWETFFLLSFYFVFLIISHLVDILLL